MIWNETLVRVIVAAALVIAVASIGVFCVWWIVLERQDDNTAEGEDANTSAPMWLWWISSACVLILAVVMMSGSPQTSQYGPNGSIIIGKRDTAIVDHIDPERYTVTSCIDDESIPAPDGHPCQKYGH